MEILTGGISAATACLFTNPMEVVKNRLQLQGEMRAKGQYSTTYRGPIHGLYIMARTDGLKSLQAGLAPAMLYQLVMNGLRLGTYTRMDNNGLTTDPTTGKVSYTRTLVCSAVAGVVGGFVGSPVFLVKTQFQTASSAAISVGTQHNHVSIGGAMRSLFRAGGLAGLWQGATASLPRIAIGSAAQLVTYSWVMEQLTESGVRTGWQKNMAGAFLSGFVVAVTISPLDVVATRLYNQPGLGQPGRLYTGYLDCVTKVIRFEGILAFYKGLTAQYMRIGPHSFLNLIFWHHGRNIMGLSSQQDS